MNKTAVVSGANGFLGRNLTTRLLAAGYDVRAIGTRYTSSNRDVDYWRIDLSEALTETAVFTGADIVFHAAAVLPTGGQDLSLNARITRNLVEALDKNLSLIHI